MTLSESSIYNNLVKLREKLYKAQFYMTKTDRIIYGTPLMQQVGDVLKKFVIAYNCRNEGLFDTKKLKGLENTEVGQVVDVLIKALSPRSRKLLNLDESLAAFVALRIDIEMCIKRNIIKYPKRMPKNPLTAMPEEFVHHEKVELFEIIASIEDDMRKWRQGVR